MQLYFNLEAATLPRQVTSLFVKRGTTSQAAGLQNKPPSRHTPYQFRRVEKFVSQLPGLSGFPVTYEDQN